MVLLLSFLARKLKALIIGGRLLISDHFAVRSIVQVLNWFAVHVRYPCRAPERVEKLSLICFNVL